MDEPVEVVGGDVADDVCDEFPQKHESPDPYSGMDMENDNKDNNADSDEGNPEVESHKEPAVGEVIPEGSLPDTTPAHTTHPDPLASIFGEEKSGLSTGFTPQIPDIKLPEEESLSDVGKEIKYFLKMFTNLVHDNAYDEDGVIIIEWAEHGLRILKDYRTLLMRDRIQLGIAEIENFMRFIKGEVRQARRVANDKLLGPKHSEEKQAWLKAVKVVETLKDRDEQRIAKKEKAKVKRIRKEAAWCDRDNYVYGGAPRKLSPQRAVSPAPEGYVGITGGVLKKREPRTKSPAMSVGRIISTAGRGGSPGASTGGLHHPLRAEGNGTSSSSPGKIRTSPTQKNKLYLSEYSGSTTLEQVNRMPGDTRQKQMQAGRNVVHRRVDNDREYNQWLKSRQENNLLRSFTGTTSGGEQFDPASPSKGGPQQVSPLVPLQQPPSK